jgi:subtilisin family serine protease
MLRVMLTCLALALPATGAMAAERVLLSPNGSQSLAASTSLSSLRAAAANEGIVPVIVGLKVPFAAEGLLSPAETDQQRAEIAEATKAFRSRYEAAINRAPDAFRSYDSLPFVALDVNQAELEQLAADTNVINISRNGENKPLLAASLPMIGANTAHTNGFTGAGQTVAIIDTGVDGNHPTLGGKVVAEACFSKTSSTLGLRSLCPKGLATSTVKGSGRNCAARVSPSCDHGTHVAGIAAGASSTAPGVARGANIIAIQVFSRVGSTNQIVARDSDIIAALEHVNSLRNTYRIAAVNLSLGSELPATWGSDGSCDALKGDIKTAIDALLSNGIVTVVGSGNDGRTDRLASPACITSAVSVGAVSVSDWGLCNLPTTPVSGSPTLETAPNKVACFSNTAASLDLFAPGAPITSAVPSRKFGTKNGTSQAAAHVTGAFAVLRSKNRNATVSEMLDALEETGVTVAADDRPGAPTPATLPKRIDLNLALDEINASPAELAYVKLGAGPGRVSFSNITPPVTAPTPCANDCALPFANDTKVTLTATPIATPTSAGVFRGWGGVCKGRRPTCTVTVAGLTQVTATFDPAPSFPLNVTRAGTAGTVETNTVTISNPIATPPLPPLVIGTPYNFVRGTRVTLTASANSSSTFVGWSGACKGKRTTCTVVMSRARDVIATFNVKSQTP